MKIKYGLHLAINQTDKDHLNYIMENYSQISTDEITQIAIFRRGLSEIIKDIIMKEIKEKENQ